MVRERIDSIMSAVRASRSTDQVPIAYAVDRLQNDIISVKRYTNSWLNFVTSKEAGRLSIS